MTWVCFDCTTIYAVGLEACPHCGSVDYVEEGDVAKITKHGGATNAAEAVAAVVAAVSEGPDETPAEAESLVVEDEATEEPVVEEAPAVDEAVSVYADWSLVDLQDECVGRGLAKSGTKAELAQRLSDDDAERIAEV